MSKAAFSFKHLLNNTAQTAPVRPAPGAKKSQSANALDKARREGATAERKRIAEILAQACPETADFAARIACQTSLAPASAGREIRAERKRRAQAAGQHGDTAALPPELKAVQARRAPKNRKGN